MRAGGLREYTAVPEGAEEDVGLRWRDIGASKDESIVRPADAPFSAMGGLKLLRGNLGRSVIKISAVAPEHHVVQAPARVFDSQEAVQQAFKDGTLDHDMVVVVRWQGPRANGMPELHKLTPVLGILQEKGRRVALLTDGRMSGASGRVPAAIHLSPEAHAGGALARVRDGDMIRLDAEAGTLDALVPQAEWQARELAVMAPELLRANMFGTGRELFGAMRTHALSAEEGACTWLQQTDALSALDCDARGAGDSGDRARRGGACGAAGARAGRRRHHDARSDIAYAGRARCMRAIGSEVEGAVVGAGTVRSAQDAVDAQAAGARFAVSPGYTQAVGQTCRDLDLPLLPGVATGSEVMQAQEDGYTELKFFPAMQAGGLAMLKAFGGPFGDILFCPTGGITPDNAPQFLALTTWPCVGGSWHRFAAAGAQRAIGPASRRWLAQRWRCVRAESDGIGSRRRGGPRDPAIESRSSRSTCSGRWSIGMAASRRKSSDLRPAPTAMRSRGPGVTDTSRPCEQVMDALSAGRGGFVKIDRLHRTILDAMLPRFGLAALTEPERRQLNLAWHRLPAWADSVRGLTRLKSRYRICTLSNGNLGLLADMARHAGLPWDLILSAETFQAYKPDPRTYLGVADVFDWHPRR